MAAHWGCQLYRGLVREVTRSLGQVSDENKVDSLHVYAASLKIGPA
ncbi:MAG: hypothetical protein KKB91_14110 [Proteobacteria bacterium]|nr:hypothetical protein [Pseudomonadota bacterium]MCG2743602.1 hypothetical protein [Desulfobacteraceae bacterium]MDO8946405.1 hypothetical protein [Desulfocapsaceae bacterium]MBU3983697.1 hypothetical protein [Pseudomonadota bacterium]MBU4028794.1 hypothetical protein [Pseudomonadota bacterium]